MKMLKSHRRDMRRAALVLAFVLASAGHAVAADAGPVVTPLLSTGTTVVGEPLHYPTSGPAHVTATIVTMAPGARTALHKHGVPMFAYVLDGEITVDYGERGKRTYRQGDAIVEAMDVAHFGADAGPQPVRLLVVYMGAEGAADVIPVH
jgi:quercetin dioxygenase-like cupin family protein